MIAAELVQKLRPPCCRNFTRAHMRYLCASGRLCQSEVEAPGIAMMRSDSGWICLWKIDFVMRPVFQRLERRGFVDVQDGVELIG